MLSCKWARSCGEADEVFCNNAVTWFMVWSQCPTIGYVMLCSFNELYSVSFCSQLVKCFFRWWHTSVLWTVTVSTTATQTIICFTGHTEATRMLWNKMTVLNIKFEQSLCWTDRQKMQIRLFYHIFLLKLKHFGSTLFHRSVPRT